MSLPQMRRSGTSKDLTVDIRSQSMQDWQTTEDPSSKCYITRAPPRKLAIRDLQYRYTLLPRITMKLPLAIPAFFLLAVTTSNAALLRRNLERENMDPSIHDHDTANRKLSSRRYHYRYYNRHYRHARHASFSGTSSSSHSSSSSHHSSSSSHSRKVWVINVTVEVKCVHH